MKERIIRNKEEKEDKRIVTKNVQWAHRVSHFTLFIQHSSTLLEKKTIKWIINYINLYSVVAFGYHSYTALL